jgi:hypothetical protein
VRELIRVSNEHRRFVVGSIVGASGMAGAEVQAESSSFMSKGRGGLANGEITEEGWADIGTHQIG